MKPRPPKSAEPTLRQKLSASYLAAFEADFASNGVAVIEALRNKSPDKYADIAARLISASEPRQDGFEQATTMQDLGRKLLKSVGCDDSTITDSMIDEAIIANDVFVARLEEIRDRAQK
jgi:hypothetical protein